MIYGYLIEPNAGLWYLFGAPLCVLAGFGFLLAGHSCLVHTKTLTVHGNARGDPFTGPLDCIARYNRRVFHWLTPLIVLFAIGVVLVPDLLYRDRNVFGWAQADNAAHIEGLDYRDLRRQGRSGEIPSLERLCSDCPVNVVSVVNHHNGLSQPSPVAFDSFLAFALGEQVLLTAFLAWIAFKFVFLFGVLSRALLRTDAAGLRLEPDFQDSLDRRFGLGQIDNLYNAVLVLVLLASIAFFLQAVANLGKGTYFFSARPGIQSIGQLFVLLAIMGMIVLVLFFPTVTFLLLIVRARSKELARLSAEMRKHKGNLDAPGPASNLESGEQVRRLRERFEIAKQQTLLPFGNRVFRRLLLVSVLLLVILPVAVASLPGSPTVRSIGKVNDFLCGVCGNSR